MRLRGSDIAIQVTNDFSDEDPSPSFFLAARCVISISVKYFKLAHRRIENLINANRRRRTRIKPAFVEKFFEQGRNDFGL